MEPLPKTRAVRSLVRPSTEELGQSAAPPEIGPGARPPSWGTFLLLLLGKIYFAKDFLLPVVLALLFAMTVRPLVYALERRGLPTPVPAVLFILVTGASLGG